MMNFKPVGGSININDRSAFNEDSDSARSKDREDLDSTEREKRERLNDSANQSNVPVMERLTATFKKRKMNSTNKGSSANGSTDPRGNKPLTSEQLFIVSYTKFISY